MKKIFLAFLIAGAMASCESDSTTTVEDTTDSIENMTDSVQTQIQTNADSAINKVERKSDSLKDAVDSLNK